MKTKVRLIEGMTMLGESGSGHTAVMDGAPDIGGRNLGVRPMEMMLLGLAGCSMIDVALILRRGRVAFDDMTIDVNAERAPADPKVFTRIRLVYTVTGKGVSRAKVERAVHLSAEKYCSASVMLAKTAELEHEIVIVER